MNMENFPGLQRETAIMLIKLWIGKNLNVLYDKWKSEQTYPVPDNNWTQGVKADVLLKNCLGGHPGHRANHPDADFDSNGRSSDLKVWDLGAPSAPNGIGVSGVCRDMEVEHGDLSKFGALDLAADSIMWKWWNDTGLRKKIDLITLVLFRGYIIDVLYIPEHYQASYRTYWKNYYEWSHGAWKYYRTFKYWKKGEMKIGRNVNDPGDHCMMYSKIYSTLTGNSNFAEWQLSFQGIKQWMHSATMLKSILDSDVAANYNEKIMELPREERQHKGKLISTIPYSSDIIHHSKNRFLDDFKVPVKVEEPRAEFKDIKRDLRLWY